MQKLPPQTSQKEGWDYWSPTAVALGVGLLLGLLTEPVTSFISKCAKSLVTWWAAVFPGARTPISLSKEDRNAITNPITANQQIALETNGLFQQLFGEQRTANTLAIESWDEARLLRQEVQSFSRNLQTLITLRHDLVFGAG
ncbi:hypothetical protein FQN50_000763, partial [Emmonsiellopsis sp. PD_5]